MTKQPNNRIIDTHAHGPLPVCNSCRKTGCDGYKCVASPDGRSKLEQQYVNLYRQVHNSNAGLWTKDIKTMTDDELMDKITELQKHYFLGPDPKKHPHYKWLTGKV